MDFASEQELIEELQRGNQRALGEVYRRFNDGIFAYCLKILADRQLAQDVVQETFIKVQQHAHAIQKGDSFKSWIFRIARNEALMQLRKRKMNGRLDDSIWVDDTPFEQFDKMERAEIVNELLDSMKHEYKEVLLLLVYENMSYAEIAAVTGATESSVKSRIFRARKEMITKLKPYLG